MVLIVVVVFALLAGFLITSWQRLEPAVITTPSTIPTATALPPTPTLPPATATTVPEDGIQSQVRAARLFDQIAHQVEIDRGLSPRTEVPLSFLDEQALRETLQSIYTAEDPRWTLLPYTISGLLPDEAVALEAQSPAGIYVVEHEQLYVGTDGVERDADAQALLAHGYVHALQDQHFDLEAMGARALTSDEELAVEALIEGDATLVTALYRSEDLASVDWERWTELIVGAERPRYRGALASDEAWMRLQRFPYDEGRRFATAVFEEGGWEAINECYTNPPRSTEQILHPERYLGQADEPSSVVVPDLGPALGEAWRPLLHDTLGEFAIGLQLSQAVTEEVAEEMAAGWDGDTLRAWQREDGRRVVVWRTIWDDGAEARAFEDGLSLLIPQRHYPVRPIDPPRGLPGRWWETDRGAVHLRRTARYVLLVRAPDTNTVINALQVLP